MKKIIIFFFFFISSFFSTGFYQLNAFDIVSSPTSNQRGDFPPGYSINAGATGCRYPYLNFSYSGTLLYSENSYCGCSSTYAMCMAVNGYQNNSHYVPFDNGKYGFFNVSGRSVLVDLINNKNIGNTNSFFYVGDNRFIFVEGTNLVIKDNQNGVLTTIQTVPQPSSFTPPDVLNHGLPVKTGSKFFYTTGSETHLLDIQSMTYYHESDSSKITLSVGNNILTSSITSPSTYKFGLYENGSLVGSVQTYTGQTFLKYVTAYENPNYYFKGGDDQIYKYDVNCNNLSYPSCRLDFSDNKFYCSNSNGVKDPNNIQCNKEYIPPTNSGSTNSGSTNPPTNSGSSSPNISQVPYSTATQLYGKVSGGIVWGDKIFFFDSDHIKNNDDPQNPTRLSCPPDRQISAKYNQQDNTTYTLSFCEPYKYSLFYKHTGTNFNQHKLGSLIYYSTGINQFGFNSWVRISSEFYQKYLNHGIRYVDFPTGWNELLEPGVNVDKYIYYGFYLNEGFYKRTGTLGDSFCNGSLGLISDDQKYFYCFDSYIKNFIVDGTQIKNINLSCSDGTKGDMVYDPGSQNIVYFQCTTGNVLFSTNSYLSSSGSIVNFDIFSGIDVSGSGIINLGVSSLLNPIVSGDLGNKSCRMFGDNLNFLYYGNGSVGINLSLPETNNIILNSMGFVTEKTLGIFISPINSALSTLMIITPFPSTPREYCLFGNIITYNPHKMFIGTEFHNKFLLMDYLILFAYGLFLISLLLSFHAIFNPFAGSEGYVEEKGIYTKKQDGEKLVRQSDGTYKYKPKYKRNYVEITTSVKRKKLKNADKFNSI